MDYVWRSENELKFEFSPKNILSMGFLDVESIAHISDLLKLFLDPAFSPFFGHYARFFTYLYRHNTVDRYEFQTVSIWDSNFAHDNEFDRQVEG